MNDWKKVLTIAISVLAFCAAVCGLIIFFKEDLQRAFGCVRERIGEKRSCHCSDDLADFDDVC